MQCACSVLYYHLWNVWLYSLSMLSHKRQYFRKKNSLNIKYVFIFLYNIFSGNFMALRRIQRVAILTVHRYPRKVPFILSDFNTTWIFWTDFWQISNVKFHKNPFIGTQIFPFVWTNRQAWSNFANAPKMGRCQNTKILNCRRHSCSSQN
jgi:hypothetical protein